MAPAGLLSVGRVLGTVVVTVRGALDLSAAATLDRVLSDLIDGQGNLAVVVELRDVARIDGAGLDVLVAAADRIASRGGELRLGEPTGAVFDSLVLAGLTGLISTPIAPGRRPSPGRRSAAASRRAAMSAHPADGSDRRHEPGDNS